MGHPSIGGRDRAKKRSPTLSGWLGLQAYNPQMQRVSRLILTGFMGAGKSTVGPILARELGWKFVDLDHVIETSSQRTVAEIFRDYGEADFRRRERDAVFTLIGQEDIVLALGGGAVEDDTSRSVLIPSHGN